MERTQPHETEANFSIEEYGAKTAEKDEREELLLTEYATLLGFYLTSAAVLTGICVQQHRLPRKFGLLDLALLGIATHKLSRIVAKDRTTVDERIPRLDRRGCSCHRNFRAPRVSEKQIIKKVEPAIA